MKLFDNVIYFLSVLGPSVITTMAGNDGGGVITYSLAGARLGYAALFTLPFLTLLYALTQEMGSRIAIVTGKGLGDLIRESFGLQTSFAMFILLLIANFGTLLTNVAALKASSEMLGLPSVIIVLLSIVATFLLITRTGYERSQRVFLLGIVFYLAYVISAIMAKPDWSDALKSLFIPKANLLDADSFLLLVAVLGTTITPWGQFFVQSYMKNKGVPVEKLRYAKFEAYLGAFLSNFFTFFMMVATAATLFVNNIGIGSGEEAALAIRPFAGEFSSVLFAVGLINAAIIGMTIVSLTSAYAFTEFFGFTGSLDESYNKGKTFYIIFLFNAILAAVLVITPFFPLFKIVLYTQSLNGILLPVFLFFILKIVNNKELMGKYVNGKIYNVFAVASSVLIVIASTLAVITTLK
ncbi:MAG: NRAMP family divalent metal transporter [Patescibacteria group bacterium]